MTETINPISTLLTWFSVKHQRLVNLALVLLFADLLVALADSQQPVGVTCIGVFIGWLIATAARSKGRLIASRVVWWLLAIVSAILATACIVGVLFGVLTYDPITRNLLLAQLVTRTLLLAAWFLANRAAAREIENRDSTR